MTLHDKILLTLLIVGVIIVIYDTWSKTVNILLSILGYLAFCVVFGIFVGKFIKAGGSNDD